MNHTGTARGMISPVRFDYAALAIPGEGKPNRPGCDRARFRRVLWAWCPECGRPWENSSPPRENVA